MYKYRVRYYNKIVKSSFSFGCYRYYCIAWLGKVLGEFLWMFLFKVPDRRFWIEKYSYRKSK